VKFKYQPWKEIIIHEIIKFTKEHFINTHSFGVPTGGIGRPISWADGIIFEIVHFRDTEDIIKEKLEGRLHWSAISYCLLEKYQREFKVEEGNIRIPIFNVSDNLMFKEMVNWIKSNFEKKKFGLF
jgi:hypothetical protein